MKTVHVLISREAWDGLRWAVAVTPGGVTVAHGTVPADTTTVESAATILGVPGKANTLFGHGGWVLASRRAHCDAHDTGCGCTQPSEVTTADV